MSKIKIAFASCVRYEANDNQTEWQDIEQMFKPDYLFLLGDQIYMDFPLIPIIGNPKYYSLQKFRKVMEDKYARQWSEKHFRALFDRLKKSDAVFGTWDDHDFAWDNAVGKHVPEEKKNASREIFHKWLGPSRNPPEVYFHVDIPHARVIFLDNRFYADKQGKNNDLLGEKQFTWLAGALEHDRLYTIICSGMTMTGTIKLLGFNLGAPERWDKYTRDYNRFCELLKRQKKVLFLAGDVHQNLFFPPEKGKRPCYEIISSGIGVNTIGIGSPVDQCRNWGALELDEKEVLVTLVEKKTPTKHRIDTTADWG